MAPKSSGSSKTKKKPRPQTAKELAEEVLESRPVKKKHRAMKSPSKHVKGQKTSIAKEVRAGTRKPPPVPDATLTDIAKMDPDDPAFKHPQGRPRKKDYEKDNEELPWTDSIRKEKQKRARQRRAKVRKREAEIVKTEERRRLERGGKPLERRGATKKVGLSLEDEMYADGILDIDDWDDEELVRGYRRKRNGKFGTPPKFIPMEVQQECLRRIIRRGKKKLDGSYIKATELLVQLAQTAESEKVRLEAIKEVMDRVGGKVPDHLKIDTIQAPYEQYLADAIEPIEEVTETTTNRVSQTEWEMDFGDDDEQTSDEPPSQLNGAKALPSSSSRPREKHPIESDILDVEPIEAKVKAKRR